MITFAGPGGGSGRRPTAVLHEVRLDTNLWRWRPVGLERRAALLTRWVSRSGVTGGGGGGRRTW